MKKLGILISFDSTKGKSVPGVDASGVRAVIKRQPRQYMNRRGGPNRHLPAEQNIDFLNLTRHCRLAGNSKSGKQPPWLNIDDLPTTKGRRAGRGAGNSKSRVRSWLNTDEPPVTRRRYTSDEIRKLTNLNRNEARKKMQLQIQKERDVKFMFIFEFLAQE